MDAGRLKQIEEIYHAALGIELDRRESFFNEHCGTDENLRREVESLLAVETNSGGFLDTPPESLATAMFSEQEIHTSRVDEEISHYKIKKLLGTGGMGEVYLAQDTRLNRPVTLKFLNAAVHGDKDRLHRFEQEAMAASALNHPNIVTIYEFAAVKGVYFLAAEYIEGETLRDVLRRDQLTMQEIFKIAEQTAFALSAAHGAGIIHRDIKPENIMIRTDGIVKVLDFGLAKLTEAESGIHKTDSDAKTRLQINTNPGSLIGTANYMSPEQARGKDVDARTDIWSLGVVLYEMLAGKRPFTGESPVDVMSAILKDEPPDLSESDRQISPSLQKLVRICLEKKPDRRFYSAHDLAFALEAVSTSSTSAFSLLESGAVFQSSPNTRKAKKTRRERLGWMFAILFAVLAAAGLFYSWKLAGNSNKQRAFRQLNFRREAIFQAGFAPDGKTVVYSAAADGNTPEIFTVQPEFNVPQPVGAPGMNLLDVSSKGELAVLIGAKYLRHRIFTGTLARMPLVGGAPREILEGVRQAAWTPDGSQLAVIREVDGKDRLEYPIGKVLNEVSGYMSDLRFSRDGSRIAFFEHPVKGDDRGSVNYVDLKGSKTMISDGYWSARGLAWSPDGAEVFFSASLTGGNYMIFAATITGTRRIMDQSPGGLILQDVAADGRWLANRIDYRYGALVHTPGMADDRDLAWLRTSKPKVMSQDGQFLVFSEDSVGNNYAVCLRKTNGSPLVQLGEGRPQDLSRDGKWVVAVIPTKPPQLVIYPTGTGETRHLDRGNIESYASAEWFRDGKSLLIGGNEPGKGPRFYVQDVSGGELRPVTPEGSGDGRLSPDGKQILARGPGGKYYLYPIDAGEPRVVEWLTDTDFVIQWSADGRYWFAYHGLAIPCRVERVDVKTGRREPFKDMAPTNRIGLLTVRPVFITDDEKSYTYTTYKQESTLFVTEAN